jgi:hypothetical protein
LLLVLRVELRLWFCEWCEQDYASLRALLRVGAAPSEDRHYA